MFWPLHDGRASAPLRLIANGNPRIRYDLAYALRAAGFETVHTGSGEMAVQFAEHVSAVLLDSNLADFSGVDVCCLLRSHPATRTLPIIRVCAGPASAFEESQSDARAVGKGSLDRAAVNDAVMRVLHVLRQAQQTR